MTLRLGAPATGPANLAELSLFGGFELKLSGKKVSLPRHARRVLAYLSVNKMVADDCDRQVMADRLWTDSPPERSRASLRTAIWRIRCIDAELLVGDSERVALADAVAVDVHEFRRHADEMLSDEVDWRPLIEVPLLRSPCELLPGWDEDWLVLTREQLRLLRLHALEHLAKRMCERGFHPQAIDTILRVVVDEPLRESAQAILIRAHLHAGNAAEACRQYHKFKKDLWNQLGLRPSADLSGLLTPAVVRTTPVSNQRRR
jgi:DNA-binding SARP family transcriptional activator